MVRKHEERVGLVRVGYTWESKITKRISEGGNSIYLSEDTIHWDFIVHTLVNRAVGP